MPSLLQESYLDNNPTLIVCGDSQPAWRLEKRFIARRNWTSNNMFIFPFYQLYLFDNGLYGAYNWIRCKPDELRIRTIEVSEESGHPTRYLEEITIEKPG